MLEARIFRECLYLFIVQVYALVNLSKIPLSSIHLVPFIFYLTSPLLYLAPFPFPDINPQPKHPRRVPPRPLHHLLHRHPFDSCHRKCDIRDRAWLVAAFDHGAALVFFFLERFGEGWGSWGGGERGGRVGGVVRCGE